MKTVTNEATEGNKYLSPSVAERYSRPEQDSERMADAYIVGTTLDDLLREVIEQVQARGTRIFPTKGEALELSGMLLEITNPRARLSRTEMRGKLFSALGELFWYLAGTNELDFISYYIHPYMKVADDGQIYGGYGPRLFSWNGLNQFDTVTEILKRKPDSRQAVIQLFDRLDLKAKKKDIPCTCTLQFMIRENKLHLLSSMRSNDIHWGLPHDVFCFTMLQEILARDLGVELGTYKHAVGSLHLYTQNIGPAKRFLKEGWQSTEAIMPAMPSGDPWPSIATVLKAEAAIRNADSLDENEVGSLPPYWIDLLCLLQVFKCKTERNRPGIERIRGKISCELYLPFVDRMLRKVASAKSSG
jgi:thymidylate synthase